MSVAVKAVTSVRVEPLGVTILVEPGETLFDAAFREGLEWPSTCYGQIECTLCATRITDGREHAKPMGEEEQHALKYRYAGDSDPRDLRLACCLELTGGDVVVFKSGVRREQSK